MTMQDPIPGSEPNHWVEYVTASVGGQLFGLPILQVQDVFVPERITRVPLASSEICGLINLRGRIVTIVDLRIRFGFHSAADGATPMAIGIELDGESYGLLVDIVGEVLKLDAAEMEMTPINLEPRLAAVSAGIHRLEKELLLVLDLRRVLDIGSAAAAA
jgi:purine-binding chemotaxis protein CheW